MRSLPLVICVALSACAPAVSSTPQSTAVVAPATAPNPRVSRRTAQRNFDYVVNRVEPVAERICRERAPDLNCDFRIKIDDRPNQPANAYQTEDSNGRPIIAFTSALIAEARNRDELAFIMSHEAAHHIKGHLSQQRRNATVGATVLGQTVGVLTGANPRSVRTAEQIGSALGSRTYSKGFELEADELGTEITMIAGFDPLVGAEFFFRIPDPGDRFLGTHPANDERLATVQRVAAGG